MFPEAEAEFEASARWYAEHAGAADEFIRAIDDALAAIEDGPLRYPLWHSGSPYRKHTLQAVPYVIYYGVLQDYVEVLAFAHSSRRPGYWLDRG